MSAHLAMLEQELADTLEAVRRRRGLPARTRVSDLARDIVGAPAPPKHGVCQFCGTRAPGRTVCGAHEDLVELDAGTSDVVTLNTTGSGRTHLDGGRAAGANGGDCT